MKVRIVYSEARNYAPSEEEFDVPETITRSSTDAPGLYRCSWCGASQLPRERRYAGATDSRAGFHVLQ